MFPWAHLDLLPTCLASPRSAKLALLAEASRICLLAPARKQLEITGNEVHQLGNQTLLLFWLLAERGKACSCLGSKRALYWYQPCPSVHCFVVQSMNDNHVIACIGDGTSMQVLSLNINIFCSQPQLHRWWLDSKVRLNHLLSMES